MRACKTLRFLGNLLRGGGGIAAMLWGQNSNEGLGEKCAEKSFKQKRGNKLKTITEMQKS